MCKKIITFFLVLTSVSLYAADSLSLESNRAASLATADFNNDNNMDFIAISGISNKIEVYLGDGNGGFSKK